MVTVSRSAIAMLLISSLLMSLSFINIFLTSTSWKFKASYIWSNSDISQFHIEHFQWAALWEWKKLPHQVYGLWALVWPSFGALLQMSCWHMQCHKWGAGRRQVSLDSASWSAAEKLMNCFIFGLAFYFQRAGVWAFWPCSTLAGKSVSKNGPWLRYQWKSMRFSSSYWDIAWSCYLTSVRGGRKPCTALMWWIILVTTAAANDAIGYLCSTLSHGVQANKRPGTEMPALKKNRETPSVTCCLLFLFLFSKSAFCPVVNSKYFNIAIVQNVL